MTLQNQRVLKDGVEYNIKVSELLGSSQGHHITLPPPSFLDNSLSTAHSLVSQTRTHACTHAQTSTPTDTTERVMIVYC